MPARARTRTSAAATAATTCYYGDPTNKPNPSLGAIDKAPFYAIKMVPGDLGTKGGLRTDADGRVLRADGTAIDGLYAAGNASSPVMGHTYAGPGATIGPAITFGYLAALRPRRAVARRGVALDDDRCLGVSCPSTPRRDRRDAARDRDLLDEFGRAALPPGPRRGRSPTDARELRYAYEQRPAGAAHVRRRRPLARVHRGPPRVSYPGIEIDLARVLHGSQRVDVHRPLPVQGSATAVQRVVDVYDKGSAAVVVTETAVTDPDGTPLWTNTSSIFARGEGGFGGERGPSGRVELTRARTGRHDHHADAAAAGALVPPAR